MVGLGAALVGALVAGTLITVDVAGSAGPLAATPLHDLPAVTTTETVGPPAGPVEAPVDLAAAVSAAEDAGDRRNVTLGVAVADRATGQLAGGSGGDETFNAASLAKLIVAVDMLDQQRAGQITLDDRDRRLVHAALAPSSDPAMNALWTEFGGPEAVTRVTREAGMEDTTAPDDPSQWGEVQTTPRDMVTLLRHVQVDMPAPDRDLLLGAMSEAPATAGDGFDQGYGLLDGSGAPVKQGWLCCLSSRADMHTMGIVGGRYVVAVMTNGPRGYDTLEESVDDAVGALRRGLGATAGPGAAR